MFTGISTSVPLYAPPRWPPPVTLRIVLLFLSLVGILRSVGSFEKPLTPVTSPLLSAHIPTQIFTQYGQNDPALHLYTTPDGLIHAPSIAGLTTTLDATTLRLGGTQPIWQWTLRSWGRETSLITPTTSAPVTLQANQARFAQGGLTSWYSAGPGGLEQGWTVATRPAGAGPLLLTFAEAGRLRGTLTADSRGLLLQDAAGVTTLRYDGLLAVDAAGRRLAAHFIQRNGGMAIVVDDTTATYPLIIDPWIQTATLTVSSGADGDHVGTAIALSADGNTLAASAPLTSAGGTQRGAVYVYIKPAGGWATTSAPTAILTVDSGADGDQLGYALALSADGSTLVVGAPFNAAGGTQRGAVHVYIKPAGGWASISAPIATLTATSGSDGDKLGYALALSANGGTLVVSAPYNAAGGIQRGAMYIYTRPGNGWVTNNSPDAILTVASGADNDILGATAIALSADGNTLVAGSITNAAGGALRGAAYVYTKPVGGWATTSAPDATLTAASSMDYTHFGWAVALSADGNTVFVGAPDAAGGTHRGAVHVYTKPTGGWVTTNTPLVTLSVTGGVNGDQLGTAIAVSPDGSTLVTSAPYSDGGGVMRGTVYVYVQQAGGWTNISPAATLTAVGGEDGDQLGLLGTVALSADSKTIIASAPYSAGGGTQRGTVYAFTLLSNNANLSGLALSQGTLSPAFAAGTTAYTAAVPNVVSSLTITPTVATTSATVTVNGVAIASGSASNPISLTVGNNTITSIVTAQDGTTKTYTVTVTRALSNNADLSSLILSSGTLSPTFAAGTTAYTAVVPNVVSSLTITPTVATTSATVTVNGIAIASGSASNPISLTVGSNIITSIVTAQDGTTKTYTVTVTRALPIRYQVWLPMIRTCTFNQWGVCIID